MSSRLFHRFKTRLPLFGLAALFAPRKPRHPLLRLVFGVIGVALLALLLVVGLFAGAAMLASGLLLRLLRQRGKPMAARDRVADGHVVEGVYRVVDKDAQPLLR